MNKYFLRIADDGTQVIISSSTAEDGALNVLFQRLNIDAEAIAVELLDVHEAGAVLAPFPVPVSAPQEAAIHQALVEFLVMQRKGLEK